MASWCTEDCVAMVVVSDVSSALPLSCAFLNCLHHCSRCLQWLRSEV